MDRALLDRYRAVRGATEQLAAPLSPEDQQLQSMPSASPTKWHRAHTTWFFETFLLMPRGVSPVDRAYGYLFNSYYEAIGPRHARPKRGMLSRPSAAEVGEYRRRVDERIFALLEEGNPRVAPLMELGLAHEEQHQELLLTDILHAFSESPLLPAYRANGRGEWVGDHSGFTFVPFEGGLVEIGAAGSAFSFDNERPRHRVWLRPYALASRPVTVAEVRAFIEAGGYDTPSLWLAEGWDWARANGIRAPMYWLEEERVFGLDGVRTPDPWEPACHVSFYEADAIARFLGGRLPTEAEWEHAATGVEVVGNTRDTGALRPRRATSAGLGQLFGDVWEWTASPYVAYPGYAPPHGAIGEYNGKFMVNQMVLRGGSCLTPPGHLRASYRNFWHPDTRFQMAGLRLAKDVS